MLGGTKSDPFSFFIVSFVFIGTCWCNVCCFLLFLPSSLSILLRILTTTGESPTLFFCVDLCKRLRKCHIEALYVYAVKSLYPSTLRVSGIPVPLGVINLPFRGDDLALPLLGTGSRR